MYPRHAGDGHLDSVLIVELFALCLRGELKPVKPDFEKPATVQIRVLVKKRSQFFGGNADQIFCAVVEQGDPLKFK